MKTYLYKAKNGPDEIIEGQMVARSTQEVVDMLVQKGYVATSVAEAKESSAGRVGSSVKHLFGVSLKERVTFTRQLSNLLSSGVPILRALGILAEQTHNRQFRGIIHEIEEEVKNGKPYSSCIQKYTKIFPVYYQAMVKAGEDSGSLDQALGRIADYYMQQYELMSKVKSALTYPLLILLVGILTIVFIFMNVMPRIIPLLTGLDVSLPVPTRILIGMSAFSRGHWYWMLLVALITALIFSRALKNKTFRYYLSGARLRCPLFGDLVFKSEFSRFARAFETAINSGIPIVTAIDITLPIVGEELIRDNLTRSLKDLEMGSMLGHSLKKTGVFPPYVYNLISIGEEAGNLPSTLGDIAASYERDCEEYIKVFTTLLEPVMVLTVGLIVAFIVSAVLMPIFQLNFMTL